MKKRNRIDILEVPYEIDQSGTPMASGPEGLLGAGFATELQAAGFQVDSRQIHPRSQRDKTTAVAGLARALGRRVAATRKQGDFPLILSGGCLASLGVVAGLREPGRRVGVVWVDAHGDFNSEDTSASGYWDGMALAALCGRALEPVISRARTPPVDPHFIVHLGGRNLDPPEVAAFHETGVLTLKAGSLRLGRVRRKLVERVSRPRELYLHVDLDGLDPADAPAVAYPEPDGVLLADLLDLIGELPRISALTFSAMSFEAAGRSERDLTVQTCRRIVERAIGR